MKNEQFKLDYREEKVKIYIKTLFFDDVKILQIVFKTYRMNAKLCSLLRSIVEFIANS